jgi:hypothetical protein
LCYFLSPCLLFPHSILTSRCMTLDPQPSFLICFFFIVFPLLLFQTSFCSPAQLFLSVFSFSYLLFFLRRIPYFSSLHVCYTYILSW